jgi:hypothetical protein
MTNHLRRIVFLTFLIGACLFNGQVYAGHPVVPARTPVQKPAATSLTAGIALWHYVTCFGTSTGWASASATGGTPPYTYSWNTLPAQLTDTASGLPAGTYTVTVTDASLATSTATITILQAPALTSTATRTNITCHGANNGTATAHPAGGRLPYTYSWNSAPSQSTSTATALVPGTYIVYINDSSGCTTSDTVAISQSPVFTSSFTHVNITCNGANNGTATALPAGGRLPYTYSWNTVPSQSTQTATALLPGTNIVYVTDSSGCTTSDTIATSQAAVLTSSVTHINITCHGANNGSATAHPAGGRLPYTYSWNSVPSQSTPTASALVPGTYIVYVSDSSGCTTSDTVGISQPAVLTSTTTQSNLSCTSTNNGSATAHPVGGRAPYTYSWNTAPSQSTQTATGLVLGTYIVYINDSSACTTSDTVTIIHSAALASTVTVNNITCNGAANGSATANPTGGNTPYTYSWNTSPPQTTQTATGFDVGTYIVYITDAGNCSTSDTITINEAPPFSVSIDTIPVGCSIKMTSNNLGGMSPYTWSWTTAPVQTTQSATTNVSGTYTLTVRDAYGCTLIDSVTIHVAPPPVVPTITISGDTLISSAPFNNQWLLQGVTLSTATGTYILPVVNGVYTVQVSNGTCIVTSAPFIYTIAGIVSLSSTSGTGFSLFPNPGKGVFNCKLNPGVDAEEFRVSVSDVLGKVVFNSLIQPSSGDKSYALDLSPLNSGVYIVSMETRAGKSLGRNKLVIQGQ